VEDDVGETLVRRVPCRTAERTKLGFGACGLHAGRTTSGEDRAVSGLPGQPAARHITAPDWFRSGLRERLDGAGTVQERRILQQDRVLAGAAGAMADLAYRFWLPPSPAELGAACNATAVDIGGVALC